MDLYKERAALAKRTDPNLRSSAISKPLSLKDALDIVQNDPMNFGLSVPELFAKAQLLMDQTIQTLTTERALSGESEFGEAISADTSIEELKERLGKLQANRSKI